MKISFPLSLKVSLWLLANLLLLAVAGGSLYVSQFGSGWASLTRGALGERLQSIGDSIASELQAEPESARPALFEARGKQTGADFFLFANNGTQLVGQKFELPAAALEELIRNPRRPGPPRRGGSPEAQSASPRDRPAGGGPPPAGRPVTGGRFVISSPDSPYVWIGLRVPIHAQVGPAIPGTVVIRADSIWTMIRLLQLGPWLAIAVGAVGLSILFWLPFVGRINRSLSRLSRATERIAQGEFATRVELSRRDEIGHLGHSVNRMAERLDTLVNGQKRFLGDVAHELGSPLGRLQVATEILESRADPALQPQIADVREEVQHMAALVNELLAFTKAGLHDRDVPLSPVPLTPLVRRALARGDPARRVTADLSPELNVLAEPALLERALGNLIRNALRYAPSGAITVSVRPVDSAAIFTVADEGPGVPTEALARLGEPFYRPDAARTNEAGGNGLGLAIVRAGVAACRGTVVFRNRAPRGFEATISLRLV